MQQLKSGSAVILCLAIFCSWARSQQVINNVTIQKAGTGLYRIKYGFNSTSDYDIEKAVLKVYRRRNENIQEVFSLPLTTLGQGGQMHSFDWRAANGLIQAGDDLQARIILTLKTSLARQRLNRIPFADAGNFMQVELPVAKPIQLNGSKSHDEDGKIVFVEWKQVGGPNDLNISRKDSLVTYVDGDFKTGTYAFELTVKDNLGSVSTSRTAVTVKGPSYWSTEQPKNKAPQKNNAVHPVLPAKQKTQLKGGPSNAALNLLLPGMGHYFVSGDQNGQNRKPRVFIISAVYVASLGGALYLRQKSNNEYKKYDQLANYREYQKDANGNIIGVRGASQDEANRYFSKAQSSHRNALICLGVGGSVLAGDLVYTFLKGSKNKREWEEENTSFKPRIIISTNGVETTAGVQFKF